MTEKKKRLEEKKKKQLKERKGSRKKILIDLFKKLNECWLVPSRKITSDCCSMTSL